MKERLCTWLDQQNEPMHALVNTWANINSSSHNPIGLALMKEELRKAFTSLVADDYIEEATGIGTTLIWQKRKSAPFQLFLGGHMDTVFASDHPFQHTRLKNKSTLIGPGVTDMKGGLVILLKAMEAVEKSSFKEKIGWRILINSDEEIGSPYSRELFKKYATSCHAALLFEPTLEDGSFVSSRSNSCNLLLTAHGQAAHVGRNPKKKNSAIDSLLQLLTQINALATKERLINIGLIKGGSALNIVAENATAHLNIRTKDEKSFAELFKVIQTKAKKLAIEIECLSYRPAKPLDKKSKELCTLLKECGKELNQKITFKSTYGVCDGNLIAPLAVPTLDTLGASGGNIHSDEEYVNIKLLAEKSKLTYLLIKKLVEKI